MSQEELLGRLSLALAIGLLIGLERGWRTREAVAGGATAGLRTFALIGLSGGLWAALTPFIGPVPLAAGFLAVAGGATLFGWSDGQREEGLGVTTLIAAYLTFALGAYAVLGNTTVAAAAAVAATALLAARTALHRWVAAMTWLELRATLILLAMSFVALPLLPDVDFGPYGAVNPHTLWLMAIAVAAVSYVGYAAVKLAGERYGTLIAGIGGGLVSSTAMTVDAARKARQTPAMFRFELSAALVASGIMFLRVLVIVALFGPNLFPSLASSLGTSAVVMLGAAFFVFAETRGAGTSSGEAAGLTNPLELTAVLRFAALLAVILVLSKWLTAVFGGYGAIAVAAIAGLADVDAVTLSMTRLAQPRLALADAERAILVVVAANSLSKSAIAFAIGGARFGAAFAAVTAFAVVAGGGAALLWVFPG